MATIDLHFVDELIALRQAQHGGGRGAPLIQGGFRIGASANRGCIVILSALLQAYIEDVFQETAKRCFPALANNPVAFDSYWQQLKKGWGNPSDVNIVRLFLKLGVPDVFAGLSWQGTQNAALRKKLDVLNQVRNRIAHGAATLTVDGTPYSLTLAKVVVFRNTVQSLASRFEGQVANFIP